MITLESKRIGKLEVNEDKIIQFADGLLGFAELKRFILADDPADLTMPFKWLVSIENPEILFLVTDPGIFFKDYAFDISPEDQKRLGAQSPEDLSVLTVLTVPENPREMTANLRGPLVINWRTFVGKQMVLSDTDFQIKHFIFSQVPDVNVQSADAGKVASPTANAKGAPAAAAINFNPTVQAAADVKMEALNS